MTFLKTLAVALITSVIVTGGAVGLFGSAGHALPQLGSVTNPDIPSPYLSFGGVRRWAGSTTNLNQATTTVCAIQAPVATSTLVSGGIRFAVSSTTASTVTIAKATTAFATSTLLNTVSVGANAQATVLAASTTLSALEQTNRTFAPNEWLVVGMAGGVGTFSPSGLCEATWEAF